MKKIIDLKTERSEIIAKMEVIAENESLTEEMRSEWDGHDSRVKAIDEEIALLERQEELNKTNVKKMEETTEIRKDEQPLAIQLEIGLRTLSTERLLSLSEQTLSLQARKPE